jgi:pimeloyl-ACP methyl ester carboxylesterase
MRTDFLPCNCEEAGLADNSGLEHVNVTANGINFHCVTLGEGDLVILLHGFPECWYSWRHQIPSLARRFKVVAPDMRGYNLSDKPESIDAYNIATLATDVRDLISAFGHEKAHVVAHDWGGAVAWAFAVMYPQHIDKLVVMNAPHPAVFVKNLRHNPRQLIRSWYMFFFQIPGVPEFALSCFDHAALKLSFRGWSLRKDAFQDCDLEELVRAASQPGALTGGINYYRAMLRGLRSSSDLTGFPIITRPTLLIWAENDRALGKELTYGLEPYFSDGLTIRYIPNCSHWVQQEQPLLVNEFLDEFL